MPAEEITEVFLKVIEPGKVVSGATKIIQFVADNGATIAEGITETAAAGNGVAAEVTAVTEIAAGTTATTGLGLLAIDVGIAGAAIAPALGILAGVGLYNLAPEFWTNVSNTLITAGQTIGGKVHALLTHDGRVAYSEETIELYKQAFINAGVFDQNFIPGEEKSSDFNIIYNDKNESVPFIQYNHFRTADFSASPAYLVYTPGNDEGFLTSYKCTETGDVVYKIGAQYKFCYMTPQNALQFHVFGELPFIPTTITGYRLYITNTFTGELSSSSSGSAFIPITLKIDGIEKTVYSLYYTEWRSISSIGETFYRNFSSLPTIPYDGRIRFAMYAIILLGSKFSPNLQSEATYPSSVPFTQTYPEWRPITVPESLPQPNYYPVEVPYVLPEQEAAQNPVSQPEINPDQWITWITENLPIPEPNSDPYPEPDPVPEPDPDPQPEPEPAPEPKPEPVEPNPPDPNEPIEPDTIPFIPPILDTVSSTKIFSVYNPTTAELDALGSYLWSNDVLETIAKIWQNPLDGVISLRQIYCTPVSSGSHNIILGSLDSGVSAAVVTSQFTTIDCGSVTIGEKNKNVTDYSPYATTHLYLPFIGIVQLDVDEVMNSTLNVKYTIDVYTGTCLAEIYVTRSTDMSVSKILYTFSGNCSQTLPLTASDATGLASTLASLGAAAIGIVAGGGALGAVAGASMVGHSLTHEMVNIGHSGSLSSNAGIMGQRKPYVIIGRRRGYDANSYNEIYGYPTNKTVFLGNCNGFIRVKAINLKSAATEEEKKEIIQLLKEGVIM